MNQFKSILAIFFFSVIFSSSPFIIAMGNYEFKDSDHLQIYKDELKEFEKQMILAQEINHDEIQDYLCKPKEEMVKVLTSFEERNKKLFLKMCLLALEPPIYLELGSRESTLNRSLGKIRAIKKCLEKQLSNYLDFLGHQSIMEIIGYDCSGCKELNQFDINRVLYDLSSYKHEEKKEKRFCQF